MHSGVCDPTWNMPMGRTKCFITFIYDFEKGVGLHDDIQGKWFERLKEF